MKVVEEKKRSHQINIVGIRRKDIKGIDLQQTKALKAKENKEVFTNKVQRRELRKTLENNKESMDTPVIHFSPRKNGQQG